MIEFGPFRYDAATRILYRGTEEFILPPRLVAVLESLLKRPGTIVPRDEVLASAWQGAFVGENSLTRAVSELRRLLGDDPRQPTFIQTIPRRGYRFIAEVSGPLGATAPIPAPSGESTSEGVATDLRLREGTIVGGYRLVDRIGAGAMGEIWRARDVELERDVAIKAIPGRLAGDAAVVERFRREARLLAAVNHPNIATIHGVEESDRRRFIVMELLDGDTLQQRLESGPLPLDDALDVALQTAAALEAAHARGIIHRDLKPANVVVGPERRVKVLDFGLAKELRPPTPDTSLYPVGPTNNGALIGTAPYVSPEQARGQPPDKRSDIWAFGCLVYELLVGRRAFERDSVADTMAAILNEEPDWEQLPVASPEGVRRLLRRCLAKDPAHRIHNIADARIELEETLSLPGRDAQAPIQPPPAPRLPAATAAEPGGWPRVLPWLVAGLTLVTAIVAFWASSIGGGVRHFTITLPAQQTLPGAMTPPLTLAPDGSAVVFVAQNAEGSSQLYYRLMDGLEARPIDGTDDARSPFFSPDGRRLGFVKGSHTIYQLSLPDGRPQKVGDPPGLPLGLAWGPDETIFFAVPQGMMTVPASGGIPSFVPGLGENAGAIAWPQFIAGERMLLFTRRSRESTIVTFDLDRKVEQTLVRGAGVGQARYLSNGVLVYAQGGQLFAKRVDLGGESDLRAGTLVGTDLFMPLVADFRVGYFGVSDNGALVYAAKPAEELESRLVMVDAGVSGVNEELLADAPGGRFRGPRVSPDGDRVVALLHFEDGTTELRVYDVGQQAVLYSRKMELPGVAHPVWEREGNSVIVRGVAAETAALYRIDLGGRTPREVVLDTKRQVFPEAFHPDRNLLAFDQGFSTGFEIWLLDLDRESAVEPLTPEHGLRASLRFSPSGRHVAYMSGELGRFNVFVEPFEPTGEKLPVSTDGGAQPLWSTDGETLYYRNGRQVMSVDINTDPELTHSKPEVLFSGLYDLSPGYLHNYDLLPDGRFVMVSSREPRTHLNVKLDWLDELEALPGTPGSGYATYGLVLLPLIAAIVAMAFYSTGRSRNRSARLPDDNQPLR